MDQSHHTKSKGDLGVLKAQAKNCQSKRVNFAADYRRAP